MKRIRTNWHAAAVCAIKITFREYSQYLQYYPEYRLLKNACRIDLLMVCKAPDVIIPHNLARIFRMYNLFEIKGINSSVTIHSYYKAIGYAALLITENQKETPYTRNEVSLSFLCHRYPRKLIKYLTKDCKKNVAKSANGIYHISRDVFPAQIIIVPELSPKEALYLRCLTDHLNDARLIEQLTADYSGHQGQQDYEEYMNQLTNANLSTEGEMLMCGEWIFRLYGTSSKEFYDKGFQDCANKVREIITGKDAVIADKDAVIADKDAEIIRLKKLLSIQD